MVDPRWLVVRRSIAGHGRIDLAGPGVDAAAQVKDLLEAALLGHRARQVITLEIDEKLAALAKSNLQRAGIDNVAVRHMDGSRGLPGEAPFDAILLSGSVAEVPPTLLAQLKVGGRLAAIVGQEPVMRATLFTRSAEHGFSSVELFDTVAPRLRNFGEPSRFRF